MLKRLVIMTRPDSMSDKDDPTTMVLTVNAADPASLADALLESACQIIGGNAATNGYTDDDLRGMSAIMTRVLARSH